MTLHDPRRRLLRSLLLLSQSNVIIDIFSLAAESELNLFVTLRELDRLDRQGLVDARRLRLTMRGLARAVPLCPQARLAAIAEGELYEARAVA